MIVVGTLSKIDDHCFGMVMVDCKVMVDRNVGCHFLCTPMVQSCLCKDNTALTMSHRPRGQIELSDHLQQCFFSNLCHIQNGHSTIGLRVAQCGMFQPTIEMLSQESCLSLSFPAPTTLDANARRHCDSEIPIAEFLFALAPVIGQ